MTVVAPSFRDSAMFLGLPTQVDVKLQAGEIKKSPSASNIRYREIKGNLSSDWESSTLREMRTACGWKVEAVPQWIEDIRNGFRLMWFIYDEATLGSVENTAPIGMIGLCLFDPNDLTLANFEALGSEKGIRAEVTSLFIYPSHRRRGIGANAIEFVESVAAGLGVEVSTMNTAAAGANMSLYLRMGYREYKERERRYPLHEILASGWTEEHCYAAFLEKVLR